MAPDPGGIGPERLLARCCRMWRWAVAASADVRVPTQLDPQASLQARCGRW